MSIRYQEFLKSKDMIFHRNEVVSLDCRDLEDLIVRVTLTSGATFEVRDILAIELVMQTKPSMFEGRKFRYPKFMWLVHNLLGHPLMQLFALVKAYKLAFWIHDVTVPKPYPLKGKR